MLSGGRKINANPNALEFTGNRFVRRGFIVDSVSGIQSSSAGTGIVRVLSDVRIWLRKSPTTDTQILLPILDLTYTERTLSSLSPTDTSAFSSPTFTFTAIYIMDLRDFYDVVKTLFAMYVLRCITLVCGVLSPLFATFLLALSLYFFFFYKNQDVVKIFLPSSEDDRGYFLAVLFVSLVCSALYITQRLYDQCTNPVFFIDWEKSWGRVSAGGGDEEGRKEVPVSVWRMIFICNVWSEIQIYRPTNIPFTLLMMYVILSGFKVKYAASPKPGGELEEGN
ncbi:hypothetical protein HK097_006742, partial [Rhizophlyctis rosea]